MNGCEIEVIEIFRNKNRDVRKKRYRQPNSNGKK